VTSSFLPYGRQTIEDDDVAAVAAALRSEFLTTGPAVERFEEAFADATGAAEAVACNSGTAALHLACLGLDLGPADTAVVPAITFVSTANAVRMTGAKVVFADVDTDTGLMTPETLHAALARSAAAGCRPRAVLPVHLNGQTCDMAGLAIVAESAGLSVIEDACHALGIPDVGATRHSEMACFSTHPVKAIATGEGGVVTTANTSLAKQLRKLRSHGMTRDADEFAMRDLAFDDEALNPWYYEMHDFGWNYRMPDVLCALGLSQLQKLERFIRRRKDIATLYDRLLAPLAPALRPVPHGNMPHGWHLYAVLVDFAGIGITRRRFMEALRADGIGTQVHYIPVNRQPYYRRHAGDVALPGADAYYARCLSLPCYPALTDCDVHRVVHSVETAVRRIVRAGT